MLHGGVVISVTQREIRAVVEVRCCALDEEQKAIFTGNAARYDPDQIEEEYRRKNEFR